MAYMANCPNWKRAAKVRPDSAQDLAGIRSDDADQGIRRSVRDRYQNVLAPSGRLGTAYLTGWR
jgi:hypothetical protein